MGSRVVRSGDISSIFDRISIDSQPFFCLLLHSLFWTLLTTVNFNKAFQNGSSRMISIPFPLLTFPLSLAHTRNYTDNCKCVFHLFLGSFFSFWYEKTRYKNLRLGPQPFSFSIYTSSLRKLITDPSFKS